MKKMRNLCAGLVLAFGLLAVGCSAKEAVPAESTAVETEAETKDPFSLGGVDVKVETNAPQVDIIASEDGAYVGTTSTNETQYSYDKYGPLGKEVWDAIALQWTTHVLNTESDLRATMDATYGPLSTKEELTQDILALTRTPQPQQESLAANQGNGTPTESTKAANTETKSQPKETQPAESKAQPKETQTSPQPKENHTAESQSQPTSNESQTPQTQQQNTSNNGLIPGTDIPSTGDPDMDAFILEQQQGGHQEDAKKAVENAPKEYEDQGKGLNWN